MTGLVYARDALLAALAVVGVFRLAIWLDARDDALSAPYDWEREGWAA